MTSAIPHHEPELIEAAARRYGGDLEKVPTTSIRKLTVRGVLIQSRYHKAQEFERMAFMIRELPQGLAETWILRMFCDSKACADYTVILKHWNPHAARMIGNYIEQLALSKEGGGGHNGIWVNNGEDTITIDPNWLEDW